MAGTPLADCEVLRNVDDTGFSSRLGLLPTRWPVFRTLAAVILEWRLQGQLSFPDILVLATRLEDWAFTDERKFVMRHPSARTIARQRVTKFRYSVA